MTMTMTKTEQKIVDELRLLSPADRAKVDESSPPIGVALESPRLGPKKTGETYEIGA